MNKSQRLAGQEMWKKARHCWLRYSNCWETVGTESSSKPWNDKQTSFTPKDERVVDRALRSAYFSDLDEIGEAYELESRKATDHNQKTVSDWNCGISAGKVEDVGILLRLP